MLPAVRLAVAKIRLMRHMIPEFVRIFIHKLLLKHAFAIENNDKFTYRCLDIKSSKFDVLHC